MKRHLNWVIPPADDGARLDQAIVRRVPESSRALAHAAIAEGGVRLNGRTAAKGRRVGAGDAVAIDTLFERTDRTILPEPDAPLTIRYVDRWLVALDKPAGQPVQPLRIGERGTLANALAARFPEIARIGDDPLMGGMAHRIDTDTSGLVLAARQHQTLAMLRRQFTSHHEVCKRYLALVAGRVDRDGERDDWLGHVPGERGRMQVLDERASARARRERAMRAVTRYRPIARGKTATLLEVTIFTGVTHQIRCQLAFAGHPLLGDALYGGPPVAGLDRHALHACRIELRHPVTGRAWCVASPWPEALRAIANSPLGMT